ncbi:mechanosensitive ion channel family protein [Thiosulfativibrio zosterae]|uniref:Mechanosensitive ion channel protein n=1 Tax=Thiosulfativibrio zosterae TaxID=2675053 RepID=A0A6F8PPD3_9GAMM|nr:mechanosensitive ion channel domain-containing protein [Thiosulfativibrio zosterae]BBP43982.1 hypothetical protein THMIRHAT_17280 [Thiosulfativibrio zosterae]
MTITYLQNFFNTQLTAVLSWAQSPNFYLQLGALMTALLIAWLTAKGLSSKLKSRFPASETSPENPANRRLAFLPLPNIPKLPALFLPLSSLLAFALVIHLLNENQEASWLIKIAQGWAMIALIFLIVRDHVQNEFVSFMLKWVGIPVVALYIFNILGPTIGLLESFAVDIGEIKISLYAVLRLFVFGAILFWLGQMLNRYGQGLIREKGNLDIRTKEVFAKLFEIVLYIVIFLVLLQGVGIDLTALAVFGGALGVGIGFGLQQIASNFISGLIILLDKSMAIGNYIEMEDGKAGILRKLNMRSSSLETYDGKIIVIPNEKFITSSFTNWTHDDPRQRYTLNFSVAYDSDIPAIPKLILDAIKQHPQVLLEPELPDCEITEFADSGVNFQLEYWMSGIDDGPNRVGSDLLMIIWKTLHENNIQIPFPQREVRILNPQN